MADVYVSIGSNVERERSIRAAVDELRGRFEAVRLSRVYESEAVGFTGNNFYNLVALFQTDSDPYAVVEALRAVEDRYGRDRRSPRFSPRTLDLDLLLYDDLVLAAEGFSLPREEITLNAFVLRPLAELAPHRHHPVLRRTFSDLWSAFDSPSQKLWPVEFRF